MKPGKRTIVILSVIIAAVLYLTIFGAGAEIKGARDMRFGIDIRGGVEAVFEPVSLDRKPTEKEVDIARMVMERRLDDQNILDREVTADEKQGFIIVRFPWKSDEKEFKPEKAIAELGRMEKLTFQSPEGEVLLEGKHIASSDAVSSDGNLGKEYFVELTFTEEGAKQFESATEQLTGRQMGIYMDEKMISNPIVQEKISSTSAVIDGLSSFDEAKELSDKINAGSLPYAMETKNFSTISPTLGNDALHIMVLAGVAAFLCICIFMVFFYRLSGIVACVGLLFQTCLQLLAIAIPQYTLTLPGIAGIILSLGMAVDANIIIAERIGEELRDGASLRESIKRGYKRAFTSVLDGNITSAIVAVILLIFGTGSMLSFGYTLLAGLVINVFIGVYFSKLLLLSIIRIPAFKELKWFRIKGEPKIYKILSKKACFFAATAVIVLLGMIGFAKNGISLDTQFTGGTVLKYEIQGNPDLKDAVRVIETVAGRDVNVHQTKEDGLGKQYAVATFSGQDGISPSLQEEVTEALQDAAGVSRAVLAETYSVQPYIGRQVLNNSVIALLSAAVLITIYVWVRFSILSGLSAGVAAILALLHDVMVVLIVFVVFGIPLNDSFVAVALTIIGYSINDTIIVYDRIRENMGKDRKIDTVSLVDQSISQSLSRSVHTSLTTSISVFILLAVSWYFGIDAIMEFSLPMFFGLISGCFSSMFIATILWALWHGRKGRKEIEEM